MRHHHRTVVALFLLLTLPMVACQSPQQRLDEASRAYEQKDWAKAASEADAAQRELQPPQRQEAALIAGMAAFQQDRMDSARERFAVAESSPDGEVAGKAKVMLGHILEKDGKYVAAAAKYDEAATRLSGDAASKARAEAEDARAKANPAPAVQEAAAATSADDDIAQDTVIAPRKTPARKPAAAKPSASAAKSGSTSGSRSSSAKTASASKSAKEDAKPSGKGHTIQCGAYPQESQAKKRAKDISDEAKRAGLPAPKVTRVTGRDGKRLWIVSVGSFPTREAAKKALAKLKVDHAEVLPALD